MPPSRTLYPRGTLKKIVKATSGRTIARNTDIIVFLDYMLFLQELMKEAGIAAKQDGERRITGKSVRRVREGVLRKFKG